MQPGDAPDWCPSCGAAYEPLQEYCLECGGRLPTNRGVVGLLAASWQRRLPWYPGDWVWPVLAFFVLTVVATAGAVAAGSSKGASIVVATHPDVTAAPGATALTIVPTSVPSAPQPTIATGPLPSAPRTGAPPVSAGPGVWPAGTSGYTNVLEATPVSAGRARAEALARRAASAGLTQTGVIDSNAYRSLRSGYYIVYSGVYSTASEAAAALASVHARGFSGAYEARVSR